MNTLINNIEEQASAKAVRFIDNILFILLSDGREISIYIDRVEWLQWLLKASPEQREKWSIELGGYAIYWDELDDGIEVCHLL
ncbi:MAG TPA: DUF2442 domain-containing protein [Thermodesulfovibrionia bacterium]|nr:DUF2442 domain-containing protein [Thermodesulfovibrionia bacterium]